MELLILLFKLATLTFTIMFIYRYGFEHGLKEVPPPTIVTPHGCTVSAREMATILFSLRMFQANIDEYYDIAEDQEHFYDHMPLKSSEVNALCERLNTKGISI